MQWRDVCTLKQRFSRKKVDNLNNVFQEAYQFVILWFKVISWGGIAGLEKNSPTPPSLQEEKKNDREYSASKNDDFLCIILNVK